MRRTARILVALTAVLVVLGLVSGTAVAGAAEAEVADEVAGAERVLVVSMPTMRWSDVVELQPPNLLGLLERSAVASMSLRTVGSMANLGRSYATIGAGNRTTTRASTDGQIYPPSAVYEGGLAGPVFERRCACGIDAAAAVHLGIAQLHLLNEELLFGARPGALGEALKESGRVAAAIGNADEALAPTSEAVHREVGLAVMDDDGRVQRGAVGPQLLVDDPTAPFGVRMDMEAAGAAFDVAWAESDLVVLEMSDLERVDRYRAVSTPEAHLVARRDAVARADELLGQVLDQVDPARDLVMVIAPSDPRELPVEITMAAFAGPGFEPGMAMSGSTQRPGYVTLPDVAPTILGAFDVPLPSSMNGAPMSAVGGPEPSMELYEELVHDNEIAVFRNAVAGPIAVVFVLFQALTYVLVVVVLAGGRQRMKPAVTFMALTTMAGPSVAFLSGLFPYEKLGLVGYSVAFFVASAALAGLALAVGGLVARTGGEVRRKASSVVAPLLLAGLILGVLIVDVATGARLQIDTVFGYHAIVAGRFAGYGNLASGLVSISAIVVATGIWGIVHLRTPAASRTGRDRLLLGGIAVLFVVTILAIGLPQFGLDVGGVLSSVPPFLLTGMFLAGIVVSWRRIVLIGVATFGVIATFGAFDLARPADQRTHLGRFISLILEDGYAGFAMVIQRKALANLNILTSSIWTFVIPVAVTFIAFLVWRQPSFIRRLQAWFPGARACLVGGVVLCVLGALLNDSGVAIPGMMFAVLLPYLTVLIFRTSEP